MKTIVFTIVFTLFCLIQSPPTAELFSSIMVSDLTKQEAIALDRIARSPTTIKLIVVECDENADKSKTIGILLPDKRFEITGFISVFGRITWKKNADSVVITISKSATNGVLVNGLIYYSGNVYAIHTLGGNGHAAVILLDKNKLPQGDK